MNYHQQGNEIFSDKGRLVATLDADGNPVMAVGMAGAHSAGVREWLAGQREAGGPDEHFAQSAGPAGSPEHFAQSAGPAGSPEHFAQSAGCEQGNGTHGTHGTHGTESTGMSAGTGPVTENGAQGAEEGAARRAQGAEEGAARLAHGAEEGAARRAQGAEEGAADEEEVNTARLREEDAADEEEVNTARLREEDAAGESDIPPLDPVLGVNAPDFAAYVKKYDLSPRDVEILLEQMELKLKGQN